jgi:3-oxoacyl-[acyl-carrier-protein] synthase-3
MSVAIVGMGEWVPERVRPNEEWPPEFVVKNGPRAEFTSVQANAAGDAIDTIVARYAEGEAGDPFLGSKRRRIAEETMTAHAAEGIAARAALADAGISGAEIDVVLSATAVPDRLTPPAACAVAHAIGATNARAMALDAVCASAVAGLEMAAALIESKRARYVLLTQSHLMTRAFPILHPASPNVGDAATAAIVTGVSNGGLRAIRVSSSGQYFDAVVWRRPKDADTPWWQPGGAIAMGSYDSEAARYLMDNTVRIGAQTLKEVGATEFDLLCSVQPRKWIPHAIAEAIGMPDRAHETFHDRAHLGSCGVVTNLLAARRAGRLRSGTTVALYAQGAGLTRGAALLEWP